MTEFIFILVAILLIFIILYRNYKGKNIYKYIRTQTSMLYDKYAPFSYKVVREKVKELGQDYTTKQYTIQILTFAIGAAVVSYLYFYSIIWSIVYAVFAVTLIPYLAYLRSKRLYSEFIFEQVQVYTTNTIMEFATVQAFVKSLEGVYESGVLEEPLLSDVKTMIDMSYKNGTITEAINFMNEKYDYYIVKNMHQIFLQITNEGARDASGSLDNMSLDIDMLVEGVYRDRMDRAIFHRKFVQFGLILYFMVMLIQFLLGTETYLEMLKIWYVQLMLHGIILLNTYFILNGEKFYNENVGAE